MKKNLNLLKILAVSIFFLILGCRQEADWTTNQQQQNRAQEFFKNNIKNGKSEDISLISNAIQRLEKINNKNNFLSKISDKKGLPVWEYLIHADIKAHQTSNKGEETSEILIIPLRQEDNFLSSLLYVENPDSDNPDIYTVTNEQLEDFVHNQQVDKTIRESVLMTFLSFDRQIFGDRKYSSIPLELFDKVHVHNGDDFKSFNISEPLKSNPNAREIMDCFKVYHCTGCQGACDGCNLCVSDYCYLTGSGVPGSTGSSGSTGTSGNDGSSTSTTGGGNNTGGSGSNTPEENIPWYLMNTEVDIFEYNPRVQALFKKLTNFKIVLQKEELDYLETRDEITEGFNNYLVNNTLEKSKFVKKSVEYLRKKPYMTWQQFKDMFLKTICEKITTHNQNTDYNAKITALDKPEVFALENETGFATAYGPQVNYESLPNIVNGNLRMPNGSKYFGFIHTHLDKTGVVKIFSPADVDTFLRACVRNADQQGAMIDAYATVITSEGNYLLKYSGDGNYSIGPNQVDSWKTWYDKEYSDLLENNQLTAPHVEKIFTQFLKEKVKVNGLEVYKTDKTTGKATKMEYDGKDNPVKTTPCP